MTKLYPKHKTGLVLLAVAFVLTLFALLTLSPSQEVKATASAQSADTCKDCHQEYHDLWSISQHGSVPIDCGSCHRLNGEGAHPEFPYSVESQAVTCETCHMEIAEQWKSSRHGEINLGCSSCHEPHSQQQKVLDETQLICANCHKEQYNSAHDATHGAAGLTCETCHLGEDSGHSFKATIVSCNECHSDIHEAGQLIAAGVVVEPIAPVEGEATAEPAAPEEAESHPAEETAEEVPADGGITLPSWLLLLAGLLIGGVGAWAIFGHEPGTPNPEK
jgi:predicted CXXCH cytochrome family protein